MMMLKKLAAIGLSAVALAFGTSNARAAIVTNGDFESTSTPFPAGSKEQFASAGVTGWVASGNPGFTYLASPGTADNSYLPVYGPFPATSPTGGNFVEADGDPVYASTISQSISGLTIGTTYTISFYQAAGQQQGFFTPTTERWAVSFGATTQLSHLMTLPGPAGPGPNVYPWEAQSLTFVATATIQTLSFMAVGTPGGEPPVSFLDGVTITAVPEPSTLSLMAFGVIGFGALRLRRRVLSAAV